MLRSLSCVHLKSSSLFSMVLHVPRPIYGAAIAQFQSRVQGLMLQLILVSSKVTQDEAWFVQTKRYVSLVGRALWTVQQLDFIWVTGGLAHAFLGVILYGTVLAQEGCVPLGTRTKLATSWVELQPTPECSNGCFLIQDKTSKLCLLVIQVKDQ